MVLNGGHCGNDFILLAMNNACVRIEYVPSKKSGDSRVEILLEYLQSNRLEKGLFGVGHRRSSMNAFLFS